MGVWDWLTGGTESNPKSLSSDVGTLTLSRVLDENDIVMVEDDPDVGPFVVVTPKVMADPLGKSQSTAPIGVELGTSSPSPYTASVRREYNRDMVGERGLKNCDRMRRSDGTVRGTLRLVKTPVLSARWFVEAGGESKADQTAADFVWRNLTREMTISWPQVLTESLLMCDFGYYMFEKVWENRVVDGKLRTVLKKLAPRHPMDVKEWHFDRNGGPAGATFYSPTGKPEDEYTIPIDKLLVFTFDREAGNIEGISLLRSAYKHWYYKEQLYKIDAIQKERHGIGIPVIKLPLNFSEADKQAADELGRNLRTNEQAHVVLPPNWDLLFAKIEGQPVDCMKSIDHHDKQIEKNILAAFLEGNAKDEDQVMFLKATRFIADIVTDVINLHLIPQMTDYNFSRAERPILRARRIGEQADWRTVSFAIRNLVGAGIIRPDDPLEERLREEMDLPKADPDTLREVKTPQAGPQANRQTTGQGQPKPPSAPEAGPPRQTPVQNPAPPRGNAGRDASGGK